MSEVLAVGRFGPSRDAALVTRLPGGQALWQADDAVLPDATLDGLLQAVLGLRAADIAHGALGSETITVSPAGDIGLKDFRRASSSVPDARLDGDLAAVLAASPCGWVPSERPRRQAGCSTPTRPAAPWCTSSALHSTPSPWMLCSTTHNCYPVAAAVASATGIEVCLALETANTFTALAGRDIAVFTVRVRFFQRNRYDAAVALSSGAIASTASWVAKFGLFLVSIGFAAEASMCRLVRAAIRR